MTCAITFTDTQREERIADLMDAIRYESDPETRAAHWTEMHALVKGRSPQQIHRMTHPAVTN